METTSERIDSLQIVRAFAFAGIFVYHAIRTFPGQGLLYEFISKGPGPWGVSVFFVLSGFLMTYSYWNRPPVCSFKNSALFSIRKIKKLYPLHLIMLFWGALYLLLLGETHLVILKRLAITIPLIQVWFPHDYQAINTVAWYLSDCVFLYFCFPALLSLIKKSTSRGTSIIAIIGIFLLQIIIGYSVYHFTDIDIKWVTYCHPLYRVGDFAIGGFLSSIYMESRNKVDQKYSLLHYSSLELIAVILNICVCICFAQASSEYKWFTFTCLFIPTSVILVYVFAQNAGILSKLLINRPVLWLAYISPYAFLIHRLVIYYFYTFTKKILDIDSLNSVLIIVIPFLITVISVYIYLAIAKYLKKQNHDHI